MQIAGAYHHAKMPKHEEKYGVIGQSRKLGDQRKLHRSVVVAFVIAYETVRLTRRLPKAPCVEPPLVFTMNTHVIGAFVTEPRSFVFSLISNIRILYLPWIHDFACLTKHGWDP
jgi:hypothetical protein